MAELSAVLTAMSSQPPFRGWWNQQASWASTLYTFREAMSRPLAQKPGCNHHIHQSLSPPLAQCWSWVRSETAGENLFLWIAVFVWHCSKTPISRISLIYTRCSRLDESPLQRNSPQWNSWAEQQGVKPVTNMPARFTAFSLRSCIEERICLGMHL